ncbi:MAG: RNA polymerase II-associated protein [Desulfurivibrio sp.]|nr:RNA polymerase II-associated protein [Desulfurivibrio sp.]
MELLCEKYGEKMARQEARCRHPGEYCKFRSSCVINMLGREDDRDGRQSAAVADEGADQPAVGTDRESQDG